MLEQILPALRATLILAVFAGVFFPLLVFVFAQTMFPFQANGSLIKDRNGRVIGSELIGQGFCQPQYFHPRPSAAGSGYAGEASGGTNLGPTSKKLIFGDKDFPGIKQLAESYRLENSLAAGAAVSVDAVTRSGSGLDPDITPENARLQLPRVARVRHVPEAAVLKLLQQSTEDRQLGFLGEPRVNVLKLNLALDKLAR